MLHQSYLPVLILQGSKPAFFFFPRAAKKTRLLCHPPPLALEGVVIVRMPGVVKVDGCRGGAETKGTYEATNTTHGIYLGQVVAMLRWFVLLHVT